jgi:bacteriorhodopsin
MDICETVTIVCLTIAFCFCGFIAALTSLLWAKIFLGMKGSLYASFVIYRLIKVLYQEHSKVSHINIIMTIFVWPLYVATWGMGPDVFHVISGRREWIIQSILSILLKTISVSYAFLTYEEVDIENASNVTFELMQYIFR